MFFKKDICDICHKKVKAKSIIAINNIKFCCYDCYDSYLKSLTTEEWYSFFNIDINKKKEKRTWKETK